MHFERLFLLFEFLGHIRFHFLLLHFCVCFVRLDFFLRLVSHDFHLFQQRFFGQFSLISDFVDDFGVLRLGVEKILRLVAFHIFEFLQLFLRVQKLLF